MGLDLTTSAVFLAGILLLLGGELYGLRRKGKGDTITENWRWADRWLSGHIPPAGWAWRVATIGLLGWIILHFAVGAH